jgi:hypothetical protein
MLINRKSSDTQWRQLTELVKSQWSTFWRDEVAAAPAAGCSEARDVLPHTAKPWGARTHLDPALARVSVSLADVARPSLEQMALLIKPNTLVVCENDIPFAIVECLEGSGTLRLTKDAHGRSRTIPLSWVKRVNARIYLDRSCDEASRDWPKLGSSPIASLPPPPSVA